MPSPPNWSCQLGTGVERAIRTTGRPILVVQNAAGPTAPS